MFEKQVDNYIEHDINPSWDELHIQAKEKYLNGWALYVSNFPKPTSGYWQLAGWNSAREAKESYPDLSPSEYYKMWNG
jgi:hypothetical protein